MLTFVHFKYARPIGEGPAGPEVASEPFNDVWSDRSVLLFGVGDSVTAGLGADHHSHSFFNRLHQNPEDEFDDMKGKSLATVLPNLSIENMALSGSDSLQHLRMLSELGEPQSENVFGIVVMTSGGNDLIHNYGRTPAREGAMYGATLEQAKPWIENFETRLNAMLEKISAHFPGGCRIFLADIYDPTDGVGDAPSVFLPDWPDGLAIHARYNEVIHKVAEQRADTLLVPMYELFLGHGSHCTQFYREHYDSADPSYWFYSNIEDPNDRGYDAIRRLFLNEIVAERNKMFPPE